MDVNDFMSRFDADRLGLSEFVRGQLLESNEIRRAWGPNYTNSMSMVSSTFLHVFPSHKGHLLQGP